MVLSTEEKYLAVPLVTAVTSIYCQPEDVSVLFSEIGLN